MWGDRTRVRVSPSVPHPTNCTWAKFRLNQITKGNTHSIPLNCISWLFVKFYLPEVGCVKTPLAKREKSV